MEKANKITHTRMVRIDEDELESLRRLAEPSTNNHGYHRQKVTNMRSRLSSNSNNNILQEVTISSHDDHVVLHEEKLVITQVPNKKLETKKSEDINESAEKFIQKFKQQLLLQRLESIENMEKMLERGL